VQVRRERDTLLLVHPYRLQTQKTRPSEKARLPSLGHLTAADVALTTSVLRMVSILPGQTKTVPCKYHMQLCLTFL
jgi:hypothetical protein